MTGLETKEHYEALVQDDTLDDTLIYRNLNNGRTKLARRRDWQELKSSDQSNSTTGNYTVEYDLPSDFSHLQKKNGVIVGDTPFNPIRLDEWELKKKYGNKFAIDIVNLKLKLTGEPESGKTITINYIKKPTRITSSAELAFPSDEDFQDLIAFEAALMYYGIENIEQARDRSMWWFNQYDELYRAFCMYDAKLKMAEKNNYSPS